MMHPRGARTRARALALVEKALEAVHGDRRDDAATALARLLLFYPAGDAIRRDILAALACLRTAHAARFKQSRSSK